MRAGVLEQLVAAGSLPRGALAVLDATPTTEPYAASTASVPGWSLLATARAPLAAVERVVAALRAVNASQNAALAGRYAGWQSMASLGQVRTAQEAAGAIPAGVQR